MFLTLLQVLLVTLITVVIAYPNPYTRYGCVNNVEYIVYNRYISFIVSMNYSGKVYSAKSPTTFIVVLPRVML